MPTKTEALDHLIDALANSDVQMQSATIAGRIDQLATAIQDGTITIGGGGESGYTVTTTPLFSETVTTTAGDMGNTATLAYAGDPSALGTLTVTLNGTDYTCARQDSGSTYWWGAPDPTDFSEYPFDVLAMSGTWYLVTETAGKYTVAAATTSVTPTANFTAAVNAVGTFPMECVNGITTGQEMNDAYVAGRIMFFRPYGYSAAYRFITGFDQDGITFIPTDASITVALDSNGVFRVTDGN